MLLLDKSLSMAPFYDQVKAYVAGEVLGPILTPGDRLIIELVYGKVQRLYSGTIASETDKAAAIRTVRNVRADGPFTDLGVALDAAGKDVAELGSPDRPKYVLLVTDERQEAPAGSPYASPDYRLRHPSLEYVRRVDLGHFRTISIGLHVGAKIASTAPEVMHFLSKPPPQRTKAAVSTGSAEGSGGSAGGSAGGQSRVASAQGETGEAPSTGRGQGSNLLLLAGAGFVVIALAASVIILVQSRKKRKNEERRGEA